MTAAAILPPLDAEPARTNADADLKRRERELRRLLAEGGYSPPRLRLMTAELVEVQRQIGEGKL
jgi:hypothetical protein